MPALPVWAKVLRRIDRLAWYAYHTHEIVRDETLFAWLGPELRAQLTLLSYSDMATYLPGGATYEAGLFPWERQLFAHPHIPRRGRVLLGAAGGGRELRALCEAGYDVVAFEPNPVLLQGALATAQRYPGARVVSATYADLVAAAAGQGPLAPYTAQPFDWVLFGWGSFTHVTEPSEQATLLAAVRRLVPTGPLAFSFFLKKAATDLPSRSRSLRVAVRSVFRRLGAGAAPAEGLGYEYGGGFVYNFSEAELRALSVAAGYEVALFDDTSFPHALLRPSGPAPSGHSR